MRTSLLLALVLVAVPAFASQPIELTLSEFKMYRHYLNAMADERVQKMKPEARVGAIAKDAKFNVKELQKVIAKGEAAGDLKAACEANLKEALEAGELKGRVAKVEVDTSEPHAVGYVQWLNEDQAQLSVEAVVAAAQAAPACPILSTLQLWASDKANPKSRVWQGLISASAAGQFKAEKAKDFAETLYVRKFEKVKSVAKGDDLSGELAPAEKQP